MAELFLRRTLSGFVAADADAEEAMRRYKVGEVYRGKIVKPRSYQHHKLIMALLSLTYKNLPEHIDINGVMVETAKVWPSFDVFRRSIAFSAGHRIYTPLADGTVNEAPGSLSFDALDEVEFTRVSGGMMSICTGLLDMSEPELAAEVSRYADENYSRVA